MEWFDSKLWLPTEDDEVDFIKNFRVIAGSSLSECGDSKGIMSKMGLSLYGDNDSLTEEIFMNTFVVMFCSEDVVLSLKRAKVLAEKKKGVSVSMGTPKDVQDYIMKEISDVDSELSEEDTEEESESEEAKKPVSDEDREKILGYYNQFYKGAISELLKRYTSLFSSGYEVIKPKGVLGSEGICYLSGSELKEKLDTSSRRMYLNFSNRMMFTESLDRSSKKIAERIYMMYSSGCRNLVYFPRKMVEYAFGRMAPTGEDQNSSSTYMKHSDASNWEAYKEKEVRKSLNQVVKASVLKFVVETADRTGVSHYDDSIADGLEDFLKYMRDCLSVCILLVEYKSSKRGYEEDVYAFKVRVCDPMDTIGDLDMTEVILKDCFMGSTGDVPFSYQPRIEPDVFVKEYAHEFNHDSAQAMPLFAYKAYLSLKEQGVEPDWNNMILGTFEDGSILRNGKHGVSLNDKLTHYIVAGSRAGKGVMTLAILASGIYSKKVPMYLDRKPEMASLLKSLSPNMFVLNGAVYEADHDTYKTFSSQDSMFNPENVPDYLCNILECNKSWLDLGDLFYMRALKLVMGIIMARGSGKLNDPNFGGQDGILFIVDEFKNFQEGYALLISKFKANLPASEDKYEIEKNNLEKLADKGTDSAEYKTQLAKFIRSYCDETFYSLSYLNSMVADLEYLSTKRDAGFDPTEKALSDIFVIGQHMEHGDMPFAEFREMLNSGRYKSCGRRGITGSYKINFTKGSFAYSMVTFKTCDAFFGRNMEDGREVYLAQTSKESKANGRLDDKASNFAYMKTFTEDKRRKIVGGNARDNIEIANSCIYFKPFLTLNDAKKGDFYTRQMFARCAGPNPNTPWVTPEEIIRENPNSAGDFVNEAVGFEGYLSMMGISDYSSVLSRGSEVANYVVQTVLGYPGTWLDFVTDLRPEWLFTIKDIVDASIYGRESCSLLHPDTNPVISEFVRFNPSLFGLGTGISDSQEGGLEGYYGFEDDFETQMKVEDMDMSDIFGDDVEDDFEDQEDNDYIGEDEVFSMDDFMSDPESDDFDKGATDEDLESVLKDSSEKDSLIKELLERISTLERIIAEGSTQSNMNRAERDFYNSPEFGEKIYESTMNQYGYRKSTDKSVFSDKVDYDGGVDGYAQLVDIVSRDIIMKFGGLENITSFKVIGGSIKVNGYFYRCKVKDMFAKSIPYDVRRDINSGNISKLFNYAYLRGMRRLSVLEFDSLSFVYNYVSYGMGYGSKVSVDLFFRDIPTLQCLCIGKKLFRRNTYMDDIQNDDVFYQPRAAERFANYSEELLGKGSRRSWQFTKDMFQSKDYGKVVKILGVTGGAVAAGTTGLGSVAVRGGRKVVKGLVNFGKSFKDMMDDSANFE